MMNCDDVKMLFSSYADKELPQEQSSIVSEHLKDCKDCSEEFKELNQLKGIISSLPRVTAPKNFASIISKRITELETSKLASDKIIQHRKLRFEPLLKAAIYLICIGISLVISFQAGVEHQKKSLRPETLALKDIPKKELVDSYKKKSTHASDEIEKETLSYYEKGDGRWGVDEKAISKTIGKDSMEKGEAKEEPLESPDAEEGVVFDERTNKQYTKEKTNAKDYPEVNQQTLQEGIPQDELAIISASNKMALTALSNELQDLGLPFMSWPSGKNKTWQVRTQLRESQITTIMEKIDTNSNIVLRETKQTQALVANNIQQLRNQRIIQLQNRQNTLAGETMAYKADKEEGSSAHNNSLETDYTKNINGDGTAAIGTVSSPKAKADKQEQAKGKAEDETRKLQQIKEISLADEPIYEIIFTFIEDPNLVKREKGETEIKESNQPATESKEAKE